jgi:hypothetical protein
MLVYTRNSRYILIKDKLQVTMFDDEQETFDLKEWPEPQIGKGMDLFIRVGENYRLITTSKVMAIF